MATAPKQPTDHKPKDPEVNGVFAFTHKGKRYEFFRPTAEVITPGWLRRNRKTEEVDATYNAIELLADEDVLDVIDHMTWKEHAAFQDEFSNHMQQVMGVSMGESSASSM